jgi:triosephosphate isomerase (TIM)
MRTPLIAGNWKMNTTLSEAVQLVRDLRQTISSVYLIEKLVCPPFISLAAVRHELAGSSIKVGAQNMYSEDKGAFTGEISPMMIKDFCEYVIIGHSERRQYFAENGLMLSKKVTAALKNNIKPILCVGENLKQYEAGQTRAVVTEQFNTSLSGVDQADSLTIAYEPVWAIGTGKAATGQQAQETIAFIRSLILSRFGSAIASEMRILYGGSVTPGNIAEFVGQPDIDGALVGGASLKANDFTAIVRSTFESRLTA